MRTTFAFALGLGALALIVSVPLAAEAHPAPKARSRPDRPRFDPQPLHNDFHRPIRYVPRPVYVHRPWIIVGPPVVVTGASPVVADAEYGLRLTALDPAGPGAAAGLQVGDVILTVGGERVQTLDDLRAATAPNVSTDLVFLRSATGQTEEATATPQGGLLGVTVEQVPVLPSGNA